MKVVVFSDCHIDGVSQVLTRDEYLKEIMLAIKASEETGCPIIFLGDNYDFKNSLDPSSTISFSNEVDSILNKSHADIYSILGNHEDYNGHELSQRDILSINGKTVFIHHGYQAKYGKCERFIPGCGKFMRAIKYIGVIYRKIYPWSLTCETSKYLKDFKYNNCPGAKYSLSGHIHPKETYSFIDNVGCRHFIFKQGVSFVDLESFTANTI